MQKLVDGAWKRIPGENGDNQLTHQDANILWDLRAEDLRWARCAPPEAAEYVVVRMNFPVLNLPAEGVDIIGTFDNWAGTPMEKLDNGWFHVELEATASQFFKFRSAGSWNQEILLYNGQTDTMGQIGDGQLVFGQLWEDSSYQGVECKWIELDWSDPDLCEWTVPEEQGIEEIVLTEKAHKVIVDGVLYIVRDNKLFNVQGVQVR
jgi:hypothetical protein